MSTTKNMEQLNMASKQHLLASHIHDVILTNAHHMERVFNFGRVVINSRFLRQVHSNISKLKNLKAQ